MSERQALRQFDKIAQKWRDLAERRREYFVDLYRSGRWKHYYSEDEFVLIMKEVVEVTETWARIAPTPAEAQKRRAQEVVPAAPERRQAGRTGERHAIRRTA